MLPRTLYSIDDRQVTLLRVLTLDLPTVVSAILLAGSWIPAAFVGGLGYVPLYFGRIVFTPTERETFVGAVVLLTLIVAPVLLWRARYFRSLLRAAVPASGQISRIRATPVEFRIDYVYWFQHRSFSGRNAIRRNHRIEQNPVLRPGRTVVVLVHQYAPEQSLVRALYRI